MSVAVPGALAVTPLYRSAADAIVWWDDPGQTWSQRLASGSGSGTVTSIAAGTGITVSPSPIVGVGTVSLTVPVSVANGGTGTATVMTAGSVVFAGVSGIYAQDNANLFWDDANNRLGIGTATPSRQLTLAGTGTTGAPTDAGVKGATLLLQASGSVVGDGGAIEFGAVGGASYFGAIKGLLRDATPNTRGDLAFYTRNANADAALTERMRIDIGGNIGIGTALPATTLDVNGTIRALASPAPTSGAGVELLYIDATSGGTVQCYDRSGGAYRPIRVTGSVVQLGAGGNADIYINASHNVGIGTASPGALLHVLGSIFAGGAVSSQGVAAGFVLQDRANPAGPSVQFYMSGGTVSLWHSVGGDWFDGRASDWFVWNLKAAVGGNGAYANISDERLKSDIAPAAVGLAEVLRIVPISYSRLPVEVPVGEAGETRLLQRPPEIGFSAQQLQNVIPEAVMVMGIELPDGTGGLKDANPTLGVTAEAITAALVNAVKELAGRVGQLEARL